MSATGKIIAEPLSIDHKPNLPREEKRIKEAGGEVSFDNRVDSMLAMSRALGDCQFKCNPRLEPAKQKVSVIPEVKVVSTEQAKFLILACDGIWDVKSNEEVVNWLNSRLKTRTSE